MTLIIYSHPKVAHSDPTQLPLTPPTSPEPDQEISEVKLNFWVGGGGGWWQPTLV